MEITKKKKNMMEPRNCMFPVEIMMMILSHLPIKSLVRFRCVCNSWFRLLTGQDSDPYFTQLRARQTSIANPNPIFIQLHNHEKLTSCFHLAPCYTQIDKFENLNAPDWYSDDPVRTNNYVKNSGVCNGLVCIMCKTPVDDHIYIWNPFTSDYIKIPPCSTRLSMEVTRRENLAIYGFGLCEATNEYKVIRVFVSWLRKLMGEHDHEFQVDVYTLGTDSWRTLQNIPFSVHPGYKVRCGALVNGALHWFACNPRKKKNRQKLISFDLKNEDFQEIVTPKGINVKDRLAHISVEELGGMLAIFYKNNFLARDIHIWVMKEYGVGYSWTKQFTLESPECYYLPLNLIGVYLPLNLIGVAKDGDIMMYNRSMFVLVNPETKSIRSIKKFEPLVFDPAMYGCKCTLLSPKYIR